MFTLTNYFRASLGMNIVAQETKQNENKTERKTDIQYIRYSVHVERTA